MKNSIAIIGVAIAVIASISFTTFTLFSSFEKTLDSKLGVMLDDLHTLKSANYLLSSQVKSLPVDVEKSLSFIPGKVEKQIADLRSHVSESLSVVVENGKRQQEVKVETKKEPESLKEKVYAQVLKSFLSNAKRSERLLVKSRTLPPFDIIVHYKNDASLATPMINEYFLYGQYDIEKVELFRRILTPKKKCTVVDIGANVGLFTLYSAALGNTVHSFELSPSNAELLRQSIAINNFGDRVTLNNLAMSSKSGDVVTFHNCLTNGNCRVILEKGSDFDKVIKVPTVTLNDALATVSEVCLMKIDVEGHEVKVLEGGKQFYERVKPEIIISEFNPRAMKEVFQSSPIEYLQYFNSLGYKIWETNFDGEPIPPSKFAEYVEKTTHLDIVMYRGEGKPELSSPEPISNRRYYSRNKELDGDMDLRPEHFASQ